VVATTREARALIFGAAGLLGSALARELERRGHPCRALDRGAADVTDPDRVAEAVRSFAPAVLYNCAAFTRVDDCERLPELAREVNGRAVAHLAAAARAAGAVLVQVSTDYVFDGAARAPYHEEAATSPLQEYGRSKLEGEQAALEWERSVVVRTSWLFGDTGPSFVATMVRLLGDAAPVRVVADQVGCPTYAPFLARALVDLAARGARGVVHYRNAEPTSWHGFAAAIARRVAPGRPVEAVSTAEFYGESRRGSTPGRSLASPPAADSPEKPRPAQRPAYSVLAVERFERIVGRRVEPWSAGLDQCLPELLAATT
jgi:dTDP-4-dehydrorhamnose reductase